MTRDEIVARIRETPMTPSQLARATGVTDRQVRRILKTLPVTTIRHGRNVYYSITTGPDDTGHEDAEYRTSPSTTPDIPVETPDISKYDTGHSSGNTGHHGEGIKPGRAGNAQEMRTLHRQTPPPSQSPARLPIAAQDTDFSRNNTGHSIDDTGHSSPRKGNAAVSTEERRCRSCPLSLATLERDTIQFVLVDRQFRDLLDRLARSKPWHRKESHGTVWITIEPVHLTLQLGGDTTIFYSDEPQDLDVIVSWVRANFTDIYTNIESLVSRIRQPHHLTRDELTVIVTDKAVIEAVLSNVGMHFGKNRTYYLKAPNTNTPGFKVYLHDGNLRMEFDCRNHFMMVSAIQMRQRLLSILADLPEAPGLFTEYLTDYYNPYEHPIIIDTGIDAILEQVKGIAAAFTDSLKTIERPQQPAPAAKRIADTLSAMESWDMDVVTEAFSRELDLRPEVTAVYLAAWAVWSGRRYRGAVLVEEVISRLSSAGTPLDAMQVSEAVAELTAAGLMRDDPDLEIAFSPAGIRLGKKLLAKWEGV